MVSPEARAAIAAMRAIERVQPRDLAADRAGWTAEELAKPLPKGTVIEGDEIGGIACEWVKTGPATGIFLLLHGGGYVNGSPITHRRLASFISKASGLDVLLPDYRLAPEHPFPAGIDDSLAVWTALLARHDLAKLTIGGDSAGAGLALGMMLLARDRGLTQPRAAALLSPWTDILARGASYETNRAADPGITAERLRECGAWYTGNADPDHPQISPVLADLSGLPPLLIQAGGIEAMLDDSAMLAAHAQAAGVDVTFRIWPGLWHVWHHHAETVPEAAAAVAEIGEFLKRWIA